MEVETMASVRLVYRFSVTAGDVRFAREQLLNGTDRVGRPFLFGSRFLDMVAVEQSESGRVSSDERFSKADSDYDVMVATPFTLHLNGEPLKLGAGDQIVLRCPSMCEPPLHICIVSAVTYTLQYSRYQMAGVSGNWDEARARHQEGNKVAAYRLLEIPSIHLCAERLGAVVEEIVKGGAHVGYCSPTALSLWSDLPRAQVSAPWPFVMPRSRTQLGKSGVPTYDAVGRWLEDLVEALDKAHPNLTWLDSPRSYASGSGANASS